MNDLKNLTCSEKIKRILSTSNYNLTTLNDEINRINGTDTSVQNLSARLKRESLKYTEVEQIANILGYELEWKPVMKVSVMRGDEIINESIQPKKIPDNSVPTNISLSDETEKALAKNNPELLSHIKSPLFLNEIELSLHTKMVDLIIENINDALNETVTRYIDLKSSKQED